MQPINSLFITNNKDKKLKKVLSKIRQLKLKYVVLDSEHRFIIGIQETVNKALQWDEKEWVYLEVKRALYCVHKAYLENEDFDILVLSGITNIRVINFIQDFYQKKHKTVTGIVEVTKKPRHLLELAFDNVYK